MFRMLLALFNLLAGFSGLMFACWLFFNSDHMGSVLRRRGDVYVATLDDANLVNVINALMHEGAKGYDLLANALLALAAASFLLVLAGLMLWSVGVRQA